MRCGQTNLSTAVCRACRHEGDNNQTPVNRFNSQADARNALLNVIRGTIAL